MRSLDYSLRSPRRGGSRRSQRQRVRRSKSQHECSMCFVALGFAGEGPAITLRTWSPARNPQCPTTEPRDGTDRGQEMGKATRQGRRRNTARSRLSRGSAIGQIIGTDDDKPVVVVVQQDQPAGQERPADQPTEGVQALGPCAGRQARSGRESYLVPLSARRSVGVLAGRVTDRDSIEWNTPGSTEIRALIGGK
jgi:hypothetical protein